MCIRFRRNIRNIARLTFNAVRKIAIFENLVSLHVTRFKTGYFIAGRPKAALLFWFFGGFRCGVPLFIVMLVIY